MCYVARNPAVCCTPVSGFRRSKLGENWGCVPSRCAGVLKARSRYKERNPCCAVHGKGLQASRSRCWCVPTERGSGATSICVMKVIANLIKFLDETKERSSRSNEGRGPRLFAVQTKRGEAGGRRLTEKGGPGPGAVCREISHKPREGAPPNWLSERPADTRKVAGQLGEGKQVPCIAPVCLFCPQNEHQLHNPTSIMHTPAHCGQLLSSASQPGIAHDNCPEGLELFFT
eukprot:3874272-Rhodomonas_salina.1